MIISSIIARCFRRDREDQEQEVEQTKPQFNMSPMTTIMTFAWLAAIGLSFTILSDFLWPILIAVAVFTFLVITLVPRRR